MTNSNFRVKNGLYVVETSSSAGNLTIVDGEIDSDQAILLDAGGDITLDADGADVVLKDAGTTYGSLTQSGGELVIKSGSTPTTAFTFSGANVTLEGNLTGAERADTLIAPRNGHYIDIDGVFKTSPAVAASHDVTFTTSGGTSGSRTTLTAASGTPFADFPQSGQVKIEGMTTGEQPYSYTRTSDTVIVSTAATFDDATAATRQITLVPPAIDINGQAAPTGLTGQFGHDGGQITLDGGKWGNATTSFSIGQMYGSVVLQGGTSAKKLSAEDNASSYLYKPGTVNVTNNLIPLFHVGGENQSMTAQEDYFTGYGTVYAAASGTTQNETVYYNFKVASDSLAMMKVKSKVANTVEDEGDSRVGTAIVSESAAVSSMNGIYFNVDDTNFSRYLGNGSASIGATDYNFAVGHIYNGITGSTQNFAMGYANRTFNDGSSLNNSAFHVGSSIYGAQGNALATQNTFFQANTSGLVAIGPAQSPTSNVTLTVGKSGETSVGGVIRIVQDTTAPATTTDRLYNEGGALYWNGTDLTAAGASNLGGLTDVSLTTPAEGAVLVYSTGTFIDATIAGTANEVEVTNAAGSITVGLPDNVTITGDLNFGNGATIVNTDTNTLTITEATTVFSGDIKLNGNDIKSSTGATAITLSGADVTVAGNLTVNGTTTAVNTTNMTVEDALIELGIVDGSAPTGTTSYDLGMLVNYYSGSAKKAGFYWDSSTTAWSLSEVVTEGGGQLLTPTAGATEMRYLYDATNYFSIDVAANGATTLSTVDSDGAVGHLTLDSDGDIILDADGANITFKDNGTAILDFVLAASNVTLDSVGDITLDVADGKDVLLHEAGIVYASIGQGSVDIANIADTAGATTIDTFDCSVYPTTKYLILVEDVTNNNYLSTEILLLGDDQPATAVGYLTQYALLYNDTELGTFSATGSGNNVSLQYDPSDTTGTANHKVRVVATRIAALS
jgi:hypothetical protein